MTKYTPTQRSKILVDHLIDTKGRTTVPRIRELTSLHHSIINETLMKKGIKLRNPNVNYNSEDLNQLQRKCGQTFNDSNFYFDCDFCTSSGVRFNLTSPIKSNSSRISYALSYKRYSDDAQYVVFKHPRWPEFFVVPVGIIIPFRGTVRIDQDWTPETINTFTNFYSMYSFLA